LNDESLTPEEREDLVKLLTIEEQINTLMYEYISYRDNYTVYEEPQSLSDVYGYVQYGEN
jgi:hypothetical protein